MSALKRAAENPPDDEPNEKKMNSMVSSSLPQVRLGTIGSEEELNIKIQEFARDRLCELLNAETKLRYEADVRCLNYETKFTENKVFYRIAKRWWSELNDEMNILCSSKNTINFTFPTSAEVQHEMNLQEHVSEEDLIRVYGIKMRQQTDFTSNIVKGIIEKFPSETQFKELLKGHVDKNRELTAELEKVENDLEDKTELCEDLSLRCEQLTKRNSRLIGQIASRSTGIEKKAAENDAKEEAILAEARTESELSADIDKLKSKNAELQTEIDRLQMMVMNPNEATITSSSIYQALKSQFSVLYQQADLLKKQAEEARQSHENMRTVFLKQLEQMELDELQCQDQIRGELISAEANYQNLKKDYDKLAVEHQQNLKQHEQAAPINREMRQLINSLQSHNRQLKTEINRYKKKVREYQSDYEQQKGLNEMKKAKDDEAMAKISLLENELMMTGKKMNLDVRTTETLEVLLQQEKEKNTQLEAITKSHHHDESSDLKKQVAVMELRYHALCSAYCRRLSELPRELFVLDQERKKIEVDHQNKLILNNQKLADSKSQEEAILNEMDKTGQAFEEMQEQNLRLIQDVRDKDKAYFTLFQERIKISSLQQLQAKEKEVLETKITQLEAQLEAQNKLIRSLEEKDNIVSTNLKNMESELQLRQQALELHKRRSIELAQLCQDQKRKEFEKQSELSEIQKLIRGKNDQLEEWKQKVKQCADNMEKRSRIKKDKHSVEDMQTMVLLEEVEGYKKKLKCPICNIEEKDAILTKCFHVFCYKCLKTRYETRQRKCPKCNQNFGGNDYHKIYIE